MTYKDFKKLHHTLDTKQYYEHIVIYKDDILLDIAKTNQGAVARELGIHMTKLSALTSLLKLPIRLVNDDNNTTSI